MNEENVNWITIVAGISGILLGATLSAIGYIVRTRQEYISILNEVLFNLLEIWHVLQNTVILDPDLFSKAYIDTVNELYPQYAGSAKDDLQLRESLSQLVIDLKNRLLYGRNISSLEDNYMSSVTKLSSISPLLAFKLNGNQNLKAYLDKIDTLFRELPEPGIGNISHEQYDVIFSGFHSSLKQPLANDMLNDMEKDLKRIAWKVDLVIWAKICWRIRSARKRRENWDEFLKTNAEHTVKKLMPSIIKIASDASKTELPSKTNKDKK